MATKEYSMAFKLGAQLGKEFGTTFGSAQKKINELQAEVRTLSQVQADISSYQKQQSAIDKTNEKLALAKKHCENYSREIEETGSSSAELNNKLADEQAKCEQLNKTLEAQTLKLGKLEGHLQDAGVDMDNLSGESNNLKDKMNNLGNEIEQFGTGGTAAFDAVGSALIAAGIAEGLKEIYEAYKECISLSSGFEATMSTVEALSGANADELNLLSTEAKELGATTAFTATEAAEAMTYMGMAGWKADQMLSGMNGVLQLAAASGEDLATTSDIVTDNLTAFGLTAADTAHFSDVLAAAATSSNTSVSIMGETFQKSAALAGALNYSVEDVAVATGLMANAGIKGSIAGTALKNMFTGLVEGVELTSESFGEVEYSAIKADGTMEGFMDTIVNLRGYFDKMTDAEKLMNAETLVGKQSIAGFMSLLNTTEADFDSLTNSIQNCAGSAEKMAKIKLDNYAGQVTLLNSATDALKVTFGEAFQTELTKIVKIATEVVSAVQAYLAEHPAITKAIIAITAEVGAFVGIYGAYLAVKKAKNVLSALSTALNIKETASVLALNKALLANPYVAVTAAVVALTAAVAAFIEFQDKEAKEVRELTQESRNQYNELQSLRSEYDEAAQAYGENSEQARQLAAEVEYLSSVYEQNKQSVAEYIDACKQQSDAWNESLDSHREAFEAVDDESARTTVLINRLAELQSQTVRTSAETAEMKAIIQDLNEELPGLNLNYDKLVNNCKKGNWLETAQEMAKTAAQAEKQKAAYEGLVEAEVTKQAAEESVLELQKKQATALAELNSAQAIYRSKWGQSTSGLGAVAAVLSSEYKDMQAAQEHYDSFTSQIEENQAIVDSATEDWNNYSNALGDAFDATYGNDEVTQQLNMRIEETTSKVVELTDKYNEAYKAAYESVSGQYQVWDEAADVVAVSASTINSNLQEQANYWSQYNTNLQNLRERTGDIEGLQQVIASFADGSEESVNAIAGMATASDTELKKIVSNYQALQEEEKKVSAGVADLKTNFTNEMAELQTELEKDVKAMNLSEEAKQSGFYTIQGFIDGANSQMGAVVAAYKKIAQAAATAIDDTFIIESPSHLMREKAVYTWQGYINGTEDMTPQVQKAMANTANVGAEAVSKQSLEAESISYGGASVSVSSPIINVYGNVNENTMEQLNAYSDDFANKVLAVIEESGVDMSRRMYR